jgi:hypothetical protein
MKKQIRTTVTKSILMFPLALGAWSYPSAPILTNASPPESLSISQSATSHYRPSNNHVKVEL